MIPAQNIFKTIAISCHPKCYTLLNIVIYIPRTGLHRVMHEREIGDKDILSHSSTHYSYILGMDTVIQEHLIFLKVMKKRTFGEHL